MPITSEIEQIINDFTSSKIGEKVYLDISIENVLVLRPLCAKGSTSLGAFWVRLLQHVNNYPVYSYPYKKLYQAGKKYELQLRVEGMSLTVALATGHLTIKGEHVIDWFVINFPDIMDRYSSPPSRQCSKRVNHVFTPDEAQQLEMERKRVMMTCLKEWPVEALEKAVSVMGAGKGNEYYESIDSDGFLAGQDVETHSHISELLNMEDTKMQLDKLREGAIVPGTVFYRLWKSTLDMWLADSGAKVFIVSPFIDCDRLIDVCSLVLKNRLTACIDTMCVSFGSLYKKFAEVKRKTISEFSAEDQVFIEYKVYGSIVYPVLDFSSSFIARVKEGRASILQSNSNFERHNLLTIKPTSVSFVEMPEYYLYDKYLDPLIG